MINALPLWQNKKILVWGDAILDRYWSGNTQRISPEAPVPVVHVQKEETRLGGAANVAKNLQCLGLAVELFAFCGQDSEGQLLKQLLLEQGIQSHLSAEPGLKTITKLRILSMHQQLIRLDFEQGFHEVDKQPLLDKCHQSFNEARVLIISDYGKGGGHQIGSLITKARQAGLEVVIDPKSSDFSLYQGASLLTPNLKEFEAVVGPCLEPHDLEKKARQLLVTHSIDAILVTQGAGGMTLIQQDQSAYHLPAQAREVFDVTGAGDTVVAIVAAGLAAGLDLQSAITWANRGAGIVVGKLGTAVVEPEELIKAAYEENLNALHLGISAVEELIPQVRALQAQGKKIVMTNGCFDILHPGHVAYLNEAKQLGDYLIVAVNDDASVKRLKGPTRPINATKERMAVLAGLKAVDWVFPFSEDTPAKVIEALIPDVLVKGGDWAPHQIVGSDTVLAHGGVVYSLRFIPGHSTTMMIEKITEGQAS